MFYDLFFHFIVHKTDLVLKSFNSDMLTTILYHDNIP